MKNIKVPALPEQLERVLDFINAELEECNCDMKTQLQIDIAAEEIYVNIAHYAYSGADGETEISCGMPDTGTRLFHIIFEDSGIPYNPLAKPDPDITLSAEQRKIGGLGIYMVKKSMDDVIYTHQDGKNRLTLIKHI